MRKVCVLLFLALSVIVGPSAASAQSEASTAHIKLARDLLTLTKVDKLFNNVLPVLLRQEMKLIKKLRPSISQDALTRFEQLFIAEARSDLTLLMDEVAKIYANLLTESELEELTSFYRTPLGQKIIEIQPLATAKSMQVGARWGQSAGRKIAERVRQQLKKEGHDI